MFVAVFLLFTPLFALAAEYRTGDTTASVAKSENPTNLYIASQTVNVDGNVNRDLVAAGSTINLNGDVQNTVIAGGGAINLKGHVGNNARLAGGTVVVSGKIDGDLTLAGGTLTIEKDAVIGGDLAVAGGTLVMNGKVGGNFFYGGGKVTLNGPVGGYAKISARDFVVGDSAVVQGKTELWSPNAAQVSNDNMKNLKGGLSYHQRESVNFNWQGFWFFNFISQILLALVLLFAIVYLLPRFSRNFVSETYRNIWKNLGVGIISLIVIPVVGVLLLISLLGIPVAFFLFMVFVLMVMAATIMTPLLIGSIIWRLFDKEKKSYLVDWKVILIGLLVALILQLIPVVGWLALLVFFLFSFGEVTMTVWGVLRKQRV